jgi:TonB family protein
LPAQHPAGPPVFSLIQPSAAKRSEPLPSYLAGVRARIQSELVYPASLQRLGVTGTVELSLRISKTGELLEESVTGSSGRPELDHLAEQAARRAFPTQPPETAGSISLKLPVEFRLR